MRTLVSATVWLVLVLTGCSSPASDETDQQTSRAQEALAREVPLVIAEPSRVGEPQTYPKARGVGLGKALATMEIPRLGKDWKWVVIEGTRTEDINRGIGHFVGTALPGQIGNTSYAGHRNGWGSPLLDFETIRAGDEIILAQRGARWVYVVEAAPEIIDAEDVWVLERPGPGRWLTITTCWPKYGNERRMYLRARLETR